MQVDGTITMTTKEFLRRCGLSQYEAETTTITTIEKTERGIKAQTSRTIKHQPKRKD